MDTYVLWSQIHLPPIIAVADDPELLNMHMSAFTVAEQAHMHIWNGDMMRTGV